jgi:folate-binding protein YgfZ
MAIHLRPSRALFRCSGPEALKLLFDVVTGRVVAEPVPAVWFALLSPQGKLQAEGLCGWAGEAFWLDVDAGAADEFFRRMRMYRLRAKVEIDDLRASHAVGWSEGAAQGIAHADPRGLGWRVVAPKAEAAGWVADDGNYDRKRIARGVAEQGPDFAADSTFPHDIGMDFLGGVDFKKGCYVGQEVVSRMQHRGTTRRRPVIAEGVDAPAGTPVMAGERDAGAIGKAVDGSAVAIVRLDRIADPETVTIGGKPAKLRIPEWGTYRFGESGSAE